MSQATDTNKPNPQGGEGDIKPDAETPKAPATNPNPQGGDNGETKKTDAKKQKATDTNKPNPQGGEGDIVAKEPTHVRVKQTRTLKLSGANDVQIPDTSTVPEQVYTIADFEKIKESLVLEGIQLEEIERF